MSSILAILRKLRKLLKRFSILKNSSIMNQTQLAKVFTIIAELMRSNIAKSHLKAIKIKHPIKILKRLLIIVVNHFNKRMITVEKVSVNILIGQMIQ